MISFNERVTGTLGGWAGAIFSGFHGAFILDALAVFDLAEMVRYSFNTALGTIIALYTTQWYNKRFLPWATRKFYQLQFVAKGLRIQALAWWNAKKGGNR
jgi:hypothetical protein